VQTLDQLIAETARCLARHAEQARDPAILAAVSGGVDSTVLAVVMTRLFHQGRLPGGLVLAHVDHGMRTDSALAAARVTDLADRLGVPCVVRRLRLDPLSASEDDMRERRYAALDEAADEVRAGVLVTAHHADDDLETILFRMMRGTGPRGLSGIPEFRRLPSGLIVLRPFLGARRQSLERVLAELGETPSEDSTNRDPRRSRNFIRHEIIPTLRASLGQALDESLFAVARSARALATLTEARANRILHDRTTQIGDWRVDFDLTGLDPADRPFLEEALRIVHVRLCGAAPLRAWLDRASSLVERPTGRRLRAGGAILVERSRRGLLVLVEHRAGAPPGQAMALQLDGAPTRFGTTEWCIGARYHGATPLSPSPREAGRNRALLDRAGAPWPWHLRRPHADDRFHPLGQPAPVDYGRFLRNRAVPRFDRDRLPVVVDAMDRILWTPGVEVAEFARIQLATNDCVELRASFV
jgi:tRNA(Ile)-lysidine synthase